MTRRTPVLPVRPDVEATRLYVALGRLVRSLRREGGGLSVSQGVFSALVTVVKEGPLRAGELSTREGVAPPSMTKVVAALEQHGLVERVPDPDDGRAALISATDDGRELVESSRAQRMHGLARRLEALDADQLAALAAALPVLETLAED